MQHSWACILQATYSHHHSPASRRSAAPRDRCRIIKRHQHGVPEACYGRIRRPAGCQQRCETGLRWAPSGGRLPPPGTLLLVGCSYCPFLRFFHCSWAVSHSHSLSLPIFHATGAGTMALAPWRRMKAPAIPCRHPFTRRLMNAARRQCQVGGN